MTWTGINPSGSVEGLRPEVAEFAVAMELKLRKHDHKTSWRDQPIEAHIRLLGIEMMELNVALDFLGDEAAMPECVDIANFSMIVRDKLRQRMKDNPKPNPIASCDPEDKAPF